MFAPEFSTEMLKSDYIKIFLTQQNSQILCHKIIPFRKDVLILGQFYFKSLLFYTPEEIKDP